MVEIARRCGSVPGFTPMRGEPLAQYRRLGAAGFQRIDIGMGEIEAGGVDVAAPLETLARLPVELNQCRPIIITMRSQKRRVERRERIGRFAQATDRPFSIWLATQW